jgi:ABC-type Fe3+/spermidine/putrescine transport system ATPase subunit
MSLVLRQVRKRFPEFDVEVSLSAGKGALLTLLGPSGCGKTTTLNIVAGFVEPESGAVLVNGRDVTRLDPRLRGIGMVFQDYALFPAMNVSGNVAFGLGARGWGRAESAKRVGELLALVRLERYERRGVAELSGGERQRVALARALAPRPDLLLLDEPLSALDARLRKDLRGEIRRIQRELGVTTVYVTHDQEEALAISDVVAVMREGKVEQAGTPLEIYRRPDTPFVAGFVGIGNLIPGRVGADADKGDIAWGGILRGGDSRQGRHATLNTRLGAFSAPSHPSLRAGDEGFFLFRPESCVLQRAGRAGARGAVPKRANGVEAGGKPGSRSPSRDTPNRIEGRVVRCEYVGDATLLEVAADAVHGRNGTGGTAARAGGPKAGAGRNASADAPTAGAGSDVFTARIPGPASCAAGERVALLLPPEDCWILPAGRACTGGGATRPA